MTESEWLSSKNPHVMMNWLVAASKPFGYYAISPPPASDRKFNLFAEACCWEAGCGIGQDAEKLIEWKSGPAANPPSWAMAWAGDQRIPSEERRADLMREIFGNPFRPLKPPNALPEHRCLSCGSPMTMTANHHHGLGLWHCTKDKSHTTRAVTIDEMRLHKKGGYSWLTPQVITLAENAYSERKRICRACKGKGILPNGSKGAGLCAACGSRQHDHCASQVRSSGAKCGCEVCWGCSPCKGTGTIDDGTLDNFRLALLADAIEEAGCDNDEVLFHLRGIVGCDRCEGAGYVYMTEALSSRTACPACGGEGLIPPGKHYRGCYVLDAILGLS